MEYRIDELAQAARTTVRNVRAYQERGLLPPPRREGRVAYYTESHLARLRLLATLLERGYSLANIAELLQTWESGSELSELLGLEQAVTTPFTDEAPAALTLPELAKLFGTTDPTIVARAVKLGILRREGLRFHVDGMKVLRAGAELHRAGIPLPALLDEIAALRRDVDRIADRFVSLVEREVFDRFGAALPPRGEAARLTELVRRARPLAEVVVVAELAHALERHIRQRLGARLGRLLAPKPEKHTKKQGEK